MDVFVLPSSSHFQPARDLKVVWLPEMPSGSGRLAVTVLQWSSGSGRLAVVRAMAMSRSTCPPAS